MNVAEVMDEIGEALATITGLRVYPWNANKVTPPAAIVDLPKPVRFDETYVRGMDTFTIPVTVIAGGMGTAASRDELAPYVAGSGAQSVKAVVDGFAYATCDSVTVTGIEFAVVTFAAVQYLAALFDVDVAGEGA